MNPMEMNPSVNSIASAASAHADLTPALLFLLIAMEADGTDPVGPDRVDIEPVVAACDSSATCGVVVAVADAGVANSYLVGPTTRPSDAREMIVPLSVIAGPEMESVVSLMMTAVPPKGVKVSPPATRASFESEALVARGMVDPPMIRE